MPATSNIDPEIPLRVHAPEIFGRLSQILGAKRQQQEVAQGAIDLQERQNVQKIMASGKDDQGQSILGDDGDPDPQKLTAAISRVAPTTGQQYIQAIQTTHANKLALQSSAGKLANENRDALSGIIRSQINNPDAKAADLASALDAYGHENPAAVPAIHYAQKLLGPFDGLDPQKKAAYLNRMAVELQPADRTAQVQNAPLTPISTGSNIELTQLQPGAVGGIQVGGTLKTDIAPQLGTNAAGQTVKIEGGGESMSVVGGANPTTAQSTNLTKGATDDQTFYTQRKAEADRAPQTKNLLSNIETLASQTKTGPYSRQVADAESFLSQRIPGFKSTGDDATKRQLLGKYVSQLLLQSYQANGAGTDAAQAQVNQAIPDPEHMTPDAIKQASRLIMAQQMIAQSRGAIAEKYKKEHGGSTAGLMAVDSQFMQHVDPRAFEYLMLPKAERSKFMQQFKTDAERAAFADGLSIIDHYGGFDYLKSDAGN